MTRSYRSHDEIVEALRGLAADVEIPPAPDYASRVAARLADRGPGTGPGAVRHLHVVRRLLLAAAVLLGTTSVLVAVPATRNALASWFGFRGVEIRSVPGPLTTSSSTAAPPIGMGHPVTLGQARRETGRRLELPANLPAPSDVYLLRDGAATVVTIAYRHVPGLRPAPESGYALIATEVFDAGEPMLEKILHSGARTRSVTVRGHSGVFIDGPQEILALAAATQNAGENSVHDIAARASAETLIWSDGVVTYRLEAHFTVSQALRLAASLR